jgi:hypothetical protein
MNHFLHHSQISAWTFPLLLYLPLYFKNFLSHPSLIILPVSRNHSNILLLLSYTRSGLLYNSLSSWFVLKMETIYSSKTSVNYQTTWCHISEDSTHE